LHTSAAYFYPKKKLEFFFFSTGEVLPQQTKGKKENKTGEIYIYIYIQIQINKLKKKKSFYQKIDII
jgi:hypothetical protein